MLFRVLFKRLLYEYVVCSHQFPFGKGGVSEVSHPDHGCAVQNIKTGGELDYALRWWMHLYQDSRNTGNQERDFGQSVEK
jgi:hypothetical protein